MILLNFGWMVDLAMSIFEFLTKFLVIWHPWHPWVCIRSYLKPLFETDMSDSSYCGDFSSWLVPSHSETSADLCYQIFGKIMLKVKPNDLNEP